MFRTRNLAVVAALLLAGVIGTGVTLFNTSVLSSNQMAAVGLAVEPEEGALPASVPEREPTFNYDERVSELREKIAGRNLTAYTDSVVSDDPEQATSTVALADEDPTDDTDSGTLTEKRCSLYEPTRTLWDARGVKMQVSEGARTFYRVGTAVASVGSTTTPTREILAELPLRKVASGTFCIPSDVIGITETGFLIRNTEVALFTSYGSNGLIGYALDGLPIYGAQELGTDACGGAVVGGQYRYILDPDRETIIACYAATPIAI